MIEQRKSRQKGNILLLTALSLTTLFMFIALAINSCTLVIAHNKLKEAADAGALAAAQQLGMGKGEAQAKGAGMLLIDKNLAQMATAAKKDITIANNTANVTITYAVPIFCGKLLHMPTYDLSANAKAAVQKTTELSPKWSAPAPPLAIFASDIKDLPSQLAGKQHSDLYAMVTEPDLWKTCANYLSNPDNAHQTEYDLICHLADQISEWATKSGSPGRKYDWSTFLNSNGNEVSPYSNPDDYAPYYYWYRNRQLACQHRNYIEFAKFIYRNLSGNNNGDKINIKRIFCYCNILFPGENDEDYSYNLVHGYKGTCSINTRLTYKSPATGSLYAINDEIERMNLDKNTNPDDIKLGQDRLRTYPVIQNPSDSSDDNSLKITGFAAFWLKDVKKGPLLLRKPQYPYYYRSVCGPASIDYGYFVKLSVPGANIQEKPSPHDNDYGMSSISLIPSN